MKKIDSFKAIIYQENLIKMESLDRQKNLSSEEETKADSNNQSENIETKVIFRNKSYFYIDGYKTIKVRKEPLQDRDNKFFIYSII